MADADNDELEVVSADADFGASAVGGSVLSVVEDESDEGGAPERELSFAAMCRQYAGQLGFGDIGIVRQLVLAEPTGKDAVALRDLIKSVVKHTPPEVQLYESERAQYMATYPEEWRAGQRDRLDYDRRVFDFYATALVRLELRIAQGDPRKAIIVRQARGRKILASIARQAGAGGS